MTRLPGQRIPPSLRLVYGRRIREELERNPGTTVARLCEVSGAPHLLVEQVRMRWRVERQAGGAA